MISTHIVVILLSSLNYYISSFVAIDAIVPEKEILKGFTIYEHGGHLGHVA